MNCEHEGSNVDDPSLCSCSDRKNGVKDDCACIWTSIAHAKCFVIFKHHLNYTQTICTPHLQGKGWSQVVCLYFKWYLNIANIMRTLCMFKRKHNWLYYWPHPLYYFMCMHVIFKVWWCNSMHSTWPKKVFIWLTAGRARSPYTPNSPFTEQWLTVTCYLEWTWSGTLKIIS